MRSRALASWALAAGSLGLTNFHAMPTRPRKIVVRIVRMIVSSVARVAGSYSRCTRGATSLASRSPHRDGNRNPRCACLSCGHGYDDMGTTTWVRRHGYDDMGTTTWVRRHGYDDMGTTTWVRRHGYDDMVLQR